MKADGLSRGWILWAQGLSLNPFWGAIRHTGSWRQKQLTTFLQHSSVFPYVARSGPTTLLLKLCVQRNPKGILWTCTLWFSRSGVMTESAFLTRSQMMLTVLLVHGSHFVLGLASAAHHSEGATKYAPLKNTFGKITLSHLKLWLCLFKIRSNIQLIFRFPQLFPKCSLMNQNVL